MSEKSVKSDSYFKSKEELKNMANAIRALSMDAVEKAKSGHPGMPMGMADVASVLFSDFMKFNPKDPKWPNRDRFILSAGHGSMLLYSLFYLTGYEDITIDEIKNFRQLHSKTAGHPEYGVASGVETTTGPLGQGLATSVGFALAERLAASRYGSDIIDYYTYVIAGDGCLMEGISQEALSFAGHLGLSKLIVLFDDNQITIDGSTDMTTSDDQCARFAASGWYTDRVDGHDTDAVRNAIAKAQKSGKPSLIACRTVIAKGAPTKAGTSASHGSPLGADEIKGARAALRWNSEPFEIPAEILENWRSVGRKSDAEYKKWQGVLKAKGADFNKEFSRLLNKELPSDFDVAVNDLKKQFSSEKPMATRKSSSVVLERLTEVVPELIGGSADLTGSNLTKTKALSPVTKNDFSGGYVYYGIREHAMGAIMNGIALSNLFIPYGGTFLVFADYCRPSIRLSALMKQRVVYVMTHDSIGLGEDGPTHQPVEHLASLRAMPNLYVMRPADAVETAECWQIALQKKDAPGLLALTRQNLPTLRTNHTDENLSARGAYILAEANGALKVTIFATGSEVEIALNAKKQLEDKGFGTRVVSVPCVELFNEQDKEYKVSFFCNDSKKVVIEAAGQFGWEAFRGPHGIFVGMNSFGESAPAEDLYKYFGITADEVVRRVEASLK